MIVGATIYVYINQCCLPCHHRQYLSDSIYDKRINLNMAQKKSVQMNVVQSVDKAIYSQWERQTVTRGGTGGLLTGLSSRTPSTPVNSPGQRRLRREQVKPLKYAAGGTTQTSDEAKDERIKLLEMKILSTNAAIVNYKERERALIKKNLEMKSAIQEMEKPNHESVKKLMRRYEKFRGGISFLNDNFTTTLQNETSSLRALEDRLEKELNVIQRELSTLEKKLQQKQMQVYILNNYKDKEYPVKAIRIGELMTELDKVEMENGDEYYDLERVIDNELDKLKSAGECKYYWQIFII